MRNIFLLLFVLLALSITSCEKEEIEPSSPSPKENLRECKNCDGNWDITDPKSAG